MNVVIDSSILRRHLALKTIPVNLLFDYLVKTDSKAILTEIVLEEIKHLYIKELRERVNRLRDAVNRLDGIPNTLASVVVPDVNYEYELNHYVEFLHEQLGTSAEDVVQYRNEYLPELVRRAVRRKKPMDDKGQQFRDVLLWLTVLDYAETQDDKILAFISANTTDFADEDRVKLHPDLTEEAEIRGVTIKYFSSLDAFLKAHASLVDFVTWEWLEENYDDSPIEEAIVAIVENRAIDRLMDDLVLVGRDRRKGSFEPTGYISTAIEEFYIYEKRDGQLVLNAKLEMDIEYAISIESDSDPDRADWEYVPMVSPDGNIDKDLVRFPESSVERSGRQEYSSVMVNVSITAALINKKLSDYRIVEWDWG